MREPRFRFPPTIPTRSTRTAKIWRARKRPPRSGRRASPPTQRLRVGVQTGAGALLAGHQRPARSRSARARSRAASPRPARRSRSTQPTRGPFLAGRQHGRARGVVRHAAGHQVPRPDQGRDADDAEARSGVPGGLRRSRAGPLVLQGAGPVRRQQQAIGRAPAQVAHLQPQQRDLAHLPGRHARRHGPQRRGAQGMSGGDRRAARSRLDAGRRALQGNAKRAACATLCQR